MKIARQLLLSLAISAGLAWSTQGIGSAAIAASDRNVQAQPVTIVELDFHAGLNRQHRNENGVAALDAVLLSRTPVRQGATMLPLVDAVRALGGELSVRVHENRLAIEIVALPTAMPLILRTLATAMNPPDFSLSSLVAARAALLKRSDARATDNWALAAEMLRRSQARFSNVAMPRDGDPFSVERLSLAQARSFYMWNYRRGDLTSFINGPQVAGLHAAIAAVGAALPGGKSPRVTSAALHLGASTIVLKTQRPALSTMIVASFAAPDPTSADFAPMLVEAALMKRVLAESAGLPIGLDSYFIDRSYGARYRRIGGEPRLLLYASGAVGHPDRVISGALALSGMIGEGKLSGAIDRFKNQAIGDFSRKESDPRELVRFLRTYRADGGLGDPIAKTIAAISAVTNADLARVAKRYLIRPTIAVVAGNDGNGP